MLLRSLDPAEWRRPTDCVEWSVRDTVSHVIGLMDEAVRLRVMLRHIVTARRRYPTRNLLDGTNAVQIDDRRSRSESQLIDELIRLAPRAVRARRRLPGVLRRTKPPSGFAMPPDFTFGHMLDVVIVRDVWMHRIDISRACDRQFTPIESDAEVVAQVVRDLDASWAGPPLFLELTGRSGGRWHIGDGEPVATARADAVEYCRSLSGRAGEFDVDITGDPSVENLLRASRVAF